MIKNGSDLTGYRTSETQPAQIDFCVMMLVFSIYNYREKLKIKIKGTNRQVVLLGLLRAGQDGRVGG